MRIVKDINNMQRICLSLRQQGKSIGFVPTMGALHAGHLSLIKKARLDNDVAVVSIFVNPKQFGPKEDFKLYPRNLSNDALLCKKQGVDIIFSPNADNVYSQGYKTHVFVERLSHLLCGEYRTGHFQGVTTIVNKLFNIVGPDIAYFGQKDAQQAIIIKQMVRDLNLPVKIKVMPIIREPDGLAMSSRNKYLSDRERIDAAVLHQALLAASNAIKHGLDSPVKVVSLIRRMIGKIKSARIQYVRIVDINNLMPVERIKDRVLIAVAVSFGKTRLIDNIIVKP